MKTLAAFHKENPVVAEGLRVLNALSPETKWTYLTYRSWVMNLKKPPISTDKRILLLMKGVRP